MENFPSPHDATLENVQKFIEARIMQLRSEILSKIPNIDDEQTKYPKEIPYNNSQNTIRDKMEFIRQMNEEKGAELKTKLDEAREKIKNDVENAVDFRK